MESKLRRTKKGQIKKWNGGAGALKESKNEEIYLKQKFKLGWVKFGENQQLETYQQFILLQNSKLYPQIYCFQPILLLFPTLQPISNQLLPPLFLSTFHLPVYYFHFISIIILIFKFYQLQMIIYLINFYMTSRLFALLLVVLCIFSASSFRLADTVEFAREGFKQITNKFGDKYWHRNHTDREQVILGSNDAPITPEGYKASLDTILDLTKNPERQRQFLECSKGPHSQFFKFGAVDVGYIGNKSTYQTILLDRRPDDCFEKVIVNFTNLKYNNINSVEVEVIAIGRKKQFCTQTYVFATASKFHVHNFVLRNKHKFTWKNMKENDYNNVVTWGIHIFRLCDSLIHWLPDVFKTVQIFVGGLGTKPHLYFFGAKPPMYMQKLNVDFIEAGTNFRWKQRKPHFVNLSSYEVKSGDFLAITRFDGIDQIIQYGAGSHSGHSAVVLQVDGVMSVVESQDGWYWPKHGIQRNDWETWKKWALNADFNVAVLPLTQDSRRRFNVTAAEQFFKKKQGLPYGYHNFLFGWIDTPKDNYPSLLDPNFVLAAFSWLQRLYEYPINRIITQGLNKRLGVQNRKMSELAVIMAKKNMTFGDLMAIPEVDGWQYSDGQSYVCSSFVAAVYRAGGLLIDIQGTEMTPKDVYTLTIYDRNFNVPKKCKDNDPTLPYCQIMGNWLMELPGYSTIEQYPHMAEKCPTVAPDYFRPQGC